MTVRLLAAALLLTACSNGGPVTSPTPSPPAYPARMAAMGDSITRAFLVCGLPSDCVESSWSTGANVESHATRIRRLSGKPLEVANVAVSGARVDDLPGQAAAAVQSDAEYVTVLIGANDACRPSADAMTSVADFTAAFDRAMSTLADGLPRARVLVASIPDLSRLWAVGKDRQEVRERWAQFGICRSALAPDAPRDRVRQRVMAYNAAMERACGRHTQCRWDGGAVFGHDFVLADVSPLDYWHPGPQGQNTLAEITWQAGYWG
ncbi:MAG TPA: GDSL-type esterase/lipase family protein [Frankiaceae bacterium]|nr:GDSL-type esterase/lipase family protein [Frankiaceae bacterium]